MAEEVSTESQNSTTVRLQRLTCQAKKFNNENYEIPVSNDHLHRNLINKWHESRDLQNVGGNNKEKQVHRFCHNFTEIWRN